MTASLVLRISDSAHQVRAIQAGVKEGAHRACPKALSPQYIAADQPRVEILVPFLHTDFARDMEKRIKTL